MDLNKSASSDDIPPYLIVCAQSFTVPISFLFKRSVTEGVVALIWKSAFITPVHKNGPKDIVEN